MRILGTLLAVLLLAGGAAWLYRDSLPFLGRAEETEVSAEAAAEAQAKLDRLLAEKQVVKLNSNELSSLLHFRAQDWAPESLHDPDVRMHGDTLVVAATIPTDRIPSHPDLDRVRDMLPDSARVEVSAGVRPLAAGQAALMVRQVEFARIPIPERYYPPILEQLGRSDQAGLEPNEMAIRLPAGVSEVRVEGGYLLLIP